jgi:hypothetical protein
MRYASAERSIAAAGAAFAYVDDESVHIVRSHQVRGFARVIRSFRRMMPRRATVRTLLVTGLVLV